MIRDFSVKLSAAQRMYMTYLDQMARWAGMRFILTDRISQHLSRTRQTSIDEEKAGLNGFFRTGTNEAVIDVTRLKGAAVLTAFHEAWHFVKQEAQHDSTLAEVVTNLEGMLDRTLNADKNFDMEARIRQVQQLHEECGQKIDREGALEEIHADALRALADRDQNLTQAAEAVEELSGVFGKIAKVLDKWKSYVQRCIRSLGSRSAEVRAMLQADEETLDKLTGWFSMARNMAGNVYEARTKNGTAQENRSEESGGQRFSISNTAQMDYDEQIRQRNHNQLKRNDDLVPMKVPTNLYKRAGLSNNPTSISGRIITKIQQNHDISNDYLNELDEHIANPYFIIDEQNNKPQAVVAFLHADQGEPVVAVIQKGVLFDGEIVNRIITMMKPNNIQEYARGLFDEVKGRGTRIIQENSQVRPESTPQEVTDILIKAAYGKISRTGEDVKQKFSLDENNDIRYSELLNEYREAQDDVTRLRSLVKSIENSAEYDQWMDRIVSAAKGENGNDEFAAYQKWIKENGYDQATKDLKKAEERLSKANKAFEDYIELRDTEKEHKAIEASGLSAEDWYRKQAVKEFGYTTNMKEAGYLLPNGKMLNFSGEKGRHFGHRGQDHRAIGSIFASREYTQSKAMTHFMEMGNIRMMPESPGIDISTAKEPTTEQYNAIRKMAIQFAGKEYFNVDLTDANGSTIGSLEYIQLSLLGCAGYVRIGDSLADPDTADPLFGGSGSEYWKTPMFYHNVWAVRRLVKGTRLFCRMKQYDIYWANIPQDQEKTCITYGKRPVVIVSNDLNNAHSDIVQVLPITSNLHKKPMSTHVFIKDQGLALPGWILGEQVLTLDKCRLMEQIGAVTKEWDRLCIQHALQVQLGMVEP